MVGEAPILSRIGRMPTVTNDATLEFLVEVPEEAERTKGLLGGATHIEARKIPASKLRESLREIANGLEVALRDLRAVGDFELTELTLQAQVNGEGGVSLLGTGGKLGASGGITLKFSPKPR